MACALTRLARRIPPAFVVWLSRSGLVLRAAAPAAPGLALPPEAVQKFWASLLLQGAAVWAPRTRTDSAPALLDPAVAGAQADIPSASPCCSCAGWRR